MNNSTRVVRACNPWMRKKRKTKSTDTMKSGFKWLHDSLDFFSRHKTIDREGLGRAVQELSKIHTSVYTSVIAFTHIVLTIRRKPTHRNGRNKVPYQ